MLQYQLENQNSSFKYNVLIVLTKAGVNPGRCRTWDKIVYCTVSETLKINLFSSEITAIPKGQ